MTTTVFNTKISEVENKIPNHDKYITTSEFNKLTAENYATGLKQANLMTKTDFDKKLASFSKRITSNKTKYLATKKKLISLITKYFNFFFNRKGEWSFGNYYPRRTILEWLFLSFKFKVDNRNVNFPAKFCLGIISHGFSNT